MATSLIPLHSRSVLPMGLVVEPPKHLGSEMEAMRVCGLAESYASYLDLDPHERARATNNGKANVQSRGELHAIASTAMLISAVFNLSLSF